MVAMLQAAVVGALITSCVSGPGLAGATADTPTGTVRLAHLSPSTPRMDFYLGGRGVPLAMAAGDVAYRAFTPYITEPPGTYALQARPAGASPHSPPALDIAIEVPPGGARTAVLLDTGVYRTPQLHVVDDQPAPAPPGTTRLRVIAAAAGVGPLQVRITGGTQLARDLPYGSASPYTTVTSRSRRLELGTRAQVIGEVATALVARSAASLILVREPNGQLAAQLVPDGISAITVQPAGVEGPHGDRPSHSSWPIPLTLAASQAATGGIDADPGGLAPPPR
jgi:hypothetical protein